MVATARRKAERAKAFAEAQAKAAKQKSKNNSTSKESSKPSQPSKTSPITTTSSNDSPTTVNPADAQQQNSPKPHRFILFIGNLPFSATTAQIKQHFASVSPSSIRHSTDKTSGKSKGFAFLEFDDYARMDVCLRTFHHSLFGGGSSSAETTSRGEGEDDDGKGSQNGERDDGMMENEARAARRKRGEDSKTGAGGPRRINVELTVGGGGSKSSARKDKLRAKNQKLGLERRKRAVDAGKEAKAARGKTVQEVQQEQEEEDQIHPSRRAKVAR